WTHDQPAALIKLVTRREQRALGLVDDTRELAGNDPDRWPGPRPRFRPRLSSRPSLCPRTSRWRRKRSAGLRLLLFLPLAIRAPHLLVEPADEFGADAIWMRLELLEDLLFRKSLRAEMPDDAVE